MQAIPPPPMDYPTRGNMPLFETRTRKQLRHAEADIRALKLFIEWHFGEDALHASEEYVAQQIRAHLGGNNV